MEESVSDFSEMRCPDLGKQWIERPVAEAAAESEEVLQ
jgi:hypothetical protein